MISELRQLADRTKTLLAQGGTTESGQQAGPVGDAELVQAVAKVLDQERIELPKAQATDENGAFELVSARAAVRHARRALQKIDGGMAPTNLTDVEVSALELIVHSVGRPAMRYRNGRVETPTNSVADNSRWRILVLTQRDAIDRVSSSVGRIACLQGSGKPVLGTGWRVGKDLVVTNRHVAVNFVKASDGDPCILRLDAAKEPFVDFAYTDGTSGAASFRVTEAVFWDCAIDLALLRLEPGSGQLPTAIAIDWRTSALGRVLPSDADGAHFDGVEVYAVGHPYRETSTPEIGGVFGGDQIDGRKRWSPGQTVGFEPKLPVVRHDCSTLAGNSGSCLISPEAIEHIAVGLHFGGKPDARGPGFGSTNFAISFAQIADHPAAPFLR